MHDYFAPFEHLECKTLSSEFQLQLQIPSPDSRPASPTILSSSLFLYTVPVDLFLSPVVHDSMNTLVHAQMIHSCKLLFLNTILFLILHLVARDVWIWFPRDNRGNARENSPTREIVENDNPKERIINYENLLSLSSNLATSRENVPEDKSALPTTRETGSGGSKKPCAYCLSEHPFSIRKAILRG